MLGGFARMVCGGERASSAMQGESLLLLLLSGVAGACAVGTRGLTLNQSRKETVALQEEPAAAYASTQGATRPTRTRPLLGAPHTLSPRPSARDIHSTAFAGVTSAHMPPP